MLFGKSDVLERNGSFAAFEFDEFIYPYPAHLCHL
jgi:hypothetical protein